MSRAEVTLPADVSSVPTARHFTESILSGWGLSDLAWPATLVVSELAANAALHAHGEQFSVRISTGTEGVRLEVSDSSLRLPQQRSYSTDATTGRGLRLVDELAADWGVIPSDGGKTIWVVLQPGASTARRCDDELDVNRLLEAFEDGDGVVPDANDSPRASSRWAA